MKLFDIVWRLSLCHHVAATCQSFWAGIAPFCEGSCPATHTAMQTSNCGDGSCCWSGSKVWCECRTSDSFCVNFWSGTAPFCNGECPQGFSVGGSSSTGNGGVCVTGSKVLCVREGCRPACVPGHITMECLLGFIGICDAGCGKYACGACFRSGSGAGTPPPDVPRPWSRLSNTQLQSFVSSCFLDLHHDIDAASISESRLRDLVELSWNDKSFHALRNNASIEFPLPLTEISPNVKIAEMGEIEGLDAILPLVSVQASQTILSPRMSTFMRMEGGINVEGVGG